MTANLQGATRMPASSMFRTAALAAVVILGGAALAPPAVSAQTAPPAANSSAAANSTAAGNSPVEARIKSLHDQLKITSAEEPQWNAVAQAMRDNAKNAGALIADRAKKTKSMTAIEDLHSYRAILQAHLDGIDKLTTAFEALYASMPDTQKKIADTVFSRRPTRAPAAKNG